MNSLYRFPASTAFGKRIPKSKLSLAKKPTGKMKRLLTECIERITWSHVLAPHTLALAESPDVPELVVLSLKLLKEQCPDSVLQYIDKAIPKPIIFELVLGDMCCMAATYKRTSRSKLGETVIYDYYRSDWMADSAFRQNLPHATNLEQLYQKMLLSLLPLEARSGETMDDTFLRAAQLKKLNRELSRLRARRQREIQFNLRIELNAEIKRVEAELLRLQANLMATDNPASESL